MSAPVAIIPDLMDDESEAGVSCCSFPPRSDRIPQQAYVGEAQYAAAQVDLTVIRRERERDGRCADCGLQTHEFEFDRLTRSLVKVPLSISNEVHRGRCLLCHPIIPQECINQVHISSSNAMNDFSTALSPKSVPFRSGTARRRVSQSNNMNSIGVHYPSDPEVQHALNVIQGSSFDIMDILSAMKRVPHDRVVQERGCERLWIFSWEDEYSAAIGCVGGISVILDAMTRFPWSAHLQQCGCESLQNLALNEFNRREIRELSGIWLIVQAMMRHVDVVGIQQCGCTALGSLAASDELHWDIRRAGGLHAIVDAARRFPDEESVVNAALEALEAMGYGPSAEKRSYKDNDCAMEDNISSRS